MSSDDYQVSSMGDLVLYESRHWLLEEYLREKFIWACYIFSDMDTFLQLTTI